MLVIREAQLRAFERPGVARFETWLFEHVRSEHRAAVASLADDELLARLRVLVARAEGYGIHREEHLVAYVELALQRGDGFEDAPELAWAAAILTGDGIDDEDRIPLLFARLESWG